MLINKYLSEVEGKIENISSIVKLFRGHTNEAEWPDGLSEAINAFDLNFSLYMSKAALDKDFKKTAPVAAVLASIGEDIAALIKQCSQFDSNIIELGSSVKENSEELRGAIHNALGGLEQELAVDSQVATVNYYNNLNNKLKVLLEDQDKHVKQVKQLLNEKEVRLAKLDDKLRDIAGSAVAELNKFRTSYENTLKEIEEKNKEIDKILGHVSGRSIAGDFESNADSEKNTANLLRSGSIFCMLIIVVMVGFSLWETTTANFDLQNAIFRIVFAFSLSVPAAYLARESAKHREQQYGYLQTALDLKAITPYIASLPDEAQHKLKFEIASKLFAPKDFSKIGSDSYPINIQELVMALVSKIENPKNKTSSE